MPVLRDVQAAFLHAVLDGDDAFAAAMVSGDGVAPEARLQIYRHHVFTTLTAVLKATYPVVCQLVDERFFNYAADRFIRARPPSAPCLFEFGYDFAEFLAAFEPCCPLVYLPDVARFEWALSLATHAEDTTPLDPATLGAVPEKDYPRLVLRLDPSLSLLTSHWPVDQIWRANQPDADPDIVIDLGSGSVTLEVRCIGNDPLFRSLDRATYAFRRALRDGRCLEAAVRDALEADEDFDLTRALQVLLAEGVVTGFAVSAAGGHLEG